MLRSDLTVCDVDNDRGDVIGWWEVNFNLNYSAGLASILKYYRIMVLCRAALHII